MDKMTEMFVSIGAMLVAVALLAVFLSKNSNTAGVITSFFSGFSGALGTAVSPITGGSGLGGMGQLGGFNPTIPGYQQ